MKSNSIAIIIFLLLLTSCQNKNEKQELTTIENEVSTAAKVENQDIVEEGKTNEYDPKTTLYFSHAFIYEYWIEGTEEERGEFWIYHNPETGNLLYVPDDEMIDFVVSDPTGDYYFFGNDGHGANTVDHQTVSWVAEEASYDENADYPISDEYIKFTKTGERHTVEDGTIAGKPIVGEEYLWAFQRLSGYQTTTVTEQIPINFYQVYGFNKIDGDIQLPVNSFEFTGIFGKHQSVTRFQSEQFVLELKAYQYNPYFAEAADYDYFIYLGDGEWEKTHLPLLEK